MLQKINPWQALAALGVVGAVVVTLIVTGHKADIGFAATGIGLVVTSLLSVIRTGGGAS